MANDLELNSITEGVFEYIQGKTQSPLDGIAILGMALLRVFDCGTDGSITLDRFAEDFRRSLIESHQSRSHFGPGTMQ